jgi:hypothetical protein
VQGSYAVTFKGKAAGELRLKMSKVRCAFCRFVAALPGRCCAVSDVELMHAVNPPAQIPGGAVGIGQAEGEQRPQT